MKLYQVVNWNENFENNKSRERDQCSFVCVPNKQHGMGFTRIMAEKDGAAIYGIWALMIGALSRQKKPRNGYLTEDGHKTGTPWAQSDLAVLWRRPVAEITRALDFLSSDKIGWLKYASVIDGERVASQGQLVTDECPSGAYEEKGIEEKGIEPPNPQAERIALRARLGEWFKRRPETKWSEKELRAFANFKPDAEQLELLGWYYQLHEARHEELKWRRKDLLTLLNNWPGEVDRAKRLQSQIGNPTPSQRPSWMRSAEELKETLARNEGESVETLRPFVIKYRESIREGGEEAKTWLRNNLTPDGLVIIRQVWGEQSPPSNV